jgi:23S rRNA (uridine2552-2'-O)-methyltransferase
VRADKSKKDQYSKRAKEQGFFARSVYKLEEIDRKHRLIPADAGKNEKFRILDLGCAPGSWLQYVCQKLGDKGQVTGIDIKEIKFSHPILRTLNKDIMEATDEDLLGDDKNMFFDVVLSDMAPNTCGIKSVDQERSMELCRMASDVAKRMLKKNGKLLIKIFHGPELKTFSNELKKLYNEVQLVKPDSSRSDSSEIFILCKGFIRG